MASSDPTKSARRALILILAAAFFINYADRGLLSITAPLLQADLRLDDSQLGILFSAFFWTYALVQIPIGWIADRYGADRVLTAGLIVWAMATMLVGFASGFVIVMALRMLLGFGESAGFPCVSKLLTVDVPVEELGFANGVVGSAYSLGPAFGTFLAGMLMVRYGWRSAFVVFGALSLLWLWPWLRIMRRRRTLPVLSLAPPPVAILLRSRGLWGTMLDLFSSNYTFFFMMSWLPVYLVRERGFSITAMAFLTSASYFAMGATALLEGFAIDRCIKRGGSTNKGYKVTMAVVHVGSVLCMLAMAFGSKPLSLSSVFVYQILAGGSAAGIYAIPEILAGPRAAGRLVGIMNSGGSVASAAAPWLTGVIIGQTGHFTLAFIVAAGMSFLGLIGWVGITPKVRQLDWAIQDNCRIAEGVC